MNSQVQAIFSKLVLPDHEIKIKFLGDSITHGVGGSGFNQNGELICEDFRRNPDGYCWANKLKNYLEKNYPCKIVNNACTGTDINFILDHYNELVSKEDEIVLCNIGTNNRHQYYTDGPMHTALEHKQAFYKNIVKLYRKLKEDGKDVVFIANIPACLENEENGPDYARLFHMWDVCDIYTKASCEEGFALIRLHELFLDDCEKRGIDYNTLLRDGLHPNDAGYDVMFRLILKEIGLRTPVSN